MENEKIFMKNINFGYETEIFKDFSIEFSAGKVSVVIGSSGCGKTSLLNLLCGLLKPKDGRIIFESKTQTLNNLSFVFQEPRLLPWRTVCENIELVLKNSYKAAERKIITEKYLSLVGLKENKDAYPSVLSGGMKQRVSIARAFAHPSNIILMDEPFQAIDLKLKIELIDLFSKLWTTNKKTSILVTHDINEAAFLGDEIFVLSNTRPVYIIEKISNKEPHSKRTRESKSFNNIQKELYRIITKKM